MDRTNADNINRFIFLIFSFMISTIIVLVIVSTGPSQFGTKASLFMAIFIFFIPACTGLLTLKFVKQCMALACFHATLITVYYPLVLLCFFVWSMIEDPCRSFVLACQALAVASVVDEVKPEEDDDEICMLPAEVRLLALFSDCAFSSYFGV